MQTNHWILRPTRMEIYVAFGIALSKVCTEVATGKKIKIESDLGTTSYVESKVSQDAQNREVVSLQDQSP